MPSFLMCPPDYYRVEYEINPWMDRRRPSDPRRSKEQWDLLRHALTDELGAVVESIEPVEGLPDMVFTANAGLVLKDQFVLASLRHPERQGESPHFLAWFKEKGFKLHTLPSECHFEGAGDGLFMKGNLFAGYRIRSDIRAHTLIGEMLGVRVLSLELVDERFYHLDTCFCPLDDRSALYYPPAFDSYGQRVIEQFVANPIPVSDEDALRFGCNAVVVSRRVVLQEGCTGIKADLARIGFESHEIDLSEFHKAGGSAKCLTLQIG